MKRVHALPAVKPNWNASTGKDRPSSKLIPSLLLHPGGMLIGTLDTINA